MMELTAPEHNDYLWWRDALAGKNPPIHDGHPQPGFYRRRRWRGGPWDPVAIWPDGNGEMLCTSGNNEAVDASEMWLWCAKNPVSYEAYQAAVDSGTWPDEPDSAGIGHNRGEDSLAESAQRAAFEAAGWLRKLGKINDQVTADKAVNWNRLLKKYETNLNKARRAEKQPHEEAAAAVDAVYRPLIDALAETARELIAAADVFAKAQKAAAEEAASRAKIEAKEAGEPEPLIEPTKLRFGGSVGKAGGFRTTRVAEIVDYSAALAHFANHAEVHALIQKLAARAVRTGFEVPGVKVKIEEKIV